MSEEDPSPQDASYDNSPSTQSIADWYNASPDDRNTDGTVSTPSSSSGSSSSDSSSSGSSTTDTPTNPWSSSGSGGNSIDKNQYDYLNNLANSGGGNAQWAQDQLANSYYNPLTNSNVSTGGGGGGSAQFNPDGSIHAVVGDKSVADISVSAGSSFGAAQDVANTFGGRLSKDNYGNYNISKDGKNVSITPIGYDSQGNPLISYRDLAEKLGYAVSYDPATSTAKFTPPPASAAPTIGNNQPGTQGDPNRVVQVLPNVGIITADGLFHPFSTGAGGGFMGQMPGQPQMPGMTPFNPGGGIGSGVIGGSGGLGKNYQFSPMPGEEGSSQFTPQDMSAYTSRLMSYNTFNPDMNKYLTQAHNQLDPQYQAQTNNLLAKQGTDIQHMDESMNRRGIYTSGIAEAAANDLRAKTTNAVANVFLQQQGAINKMAQQLSQDAYKQFQQGNQFALKNNEFLMQQMFNEQKQQYSQWLGTQKLNISQYTTAVNAWDKMANMMWHDAQMQMQDAHYQTDQAQKKFAFDNLSASQQAGINNSANQLDFNKYKFTHLSADQMANLERDSAKMFGVGANGRPTLEALKAGGLTPVGVDGAGNIQFQPTQTASDADRKYALEVAKAQGGWTDAQGNIIMPTEQARHDQATEQQAHQQLAATISHWATQDQLSSARIGLDQQKFGEKASYDQAMIDKASAAATNAMKKTQLEAYKTQLSEVGKQINNYITNGHPEQIPPDLITNYNGIMKKVDAVVNMGGG